jgi:creatinine amidohydrolase
MAAHGPELAILTAADVRAGGFDKAVIGVGATEYHGDHLPYGSDTLIAHELALRVAGCLPGMLVLPPVAFGMSWHHLSFPWTLSVSPETLAAILYDLGASLHAHGIGKLLVITAHDGNAAPVEIAARRLHHEYDMHIAAMLVWQGRAQRALAETECPVDLDHAGQSETAAIMAIAPHLARHERATDEPNEPTDLPVRIFGSFSQLAAVGYSGAPTQGAAADGERILSAAVEDVMPFLRALDANGWQPGVWMRDWRADGHE